MKEKEGGIRLQIARGGEKNTLFCNDVVTSLVIQNAQENQNSKTVTRVVLNIILHVKIPLQTSLSQILIYL